MRAVDGGAPRTSQPRLRAVEVPPLDATAPLFPRAAGAALRRTGGLLAATWVLGVVLALTAPGRWAVLGASLTLPGGGHLATGHLAHFVLSSVTLALAVLVWWMIGAFALPIAVWLLDLALVLLLGGHGHPATDTWLAVTLAAGPAVVAGSLGVHALRHHARRGRAARLNGELARTPLSVTTVPSQDALPVGEASADDLERLRFALDLALQDVDSFEGFDRRDQFREAALRYQLSILGYALSVYQYTRAPAMSGYLMQAQARTIERFADRRVWGYWALENAWGRFSTRRDPVDNRDNVMLTGWQGASVSMFATLADDRFSAPGALTYRWSATESYAYDLPSLVASIERNLERSAYTLYSCEPRWIYPVCNSFALNTLLMDRRLTGGTGHDRLVGRFEEAFLREFHRPDGRVVGVRSETTGLSWNAWAGDAVWLPTTYWHHASLPAVARRSWWMLRETVLREEDGRYRLPTRLSNRCDSGSYSFGRETFGQVFLAMTAREMGDEDVASSVLSHLAETVPTVRSDGAARLSGLSTQGNLYELMARFGRPSAMRDLIAHGAPEAWRTGPRLAEAAYPDVLVARAVTDGQALSLVLRPGATPGRTRVSVDRLRPGATYVVTGATRPEVTADHHGRASLQVDLGDRLAVEIRPRG